MSKQTFTLAAIALLGVAMGAGAQATSTTAAGAAPATGEEVIRRMHDRYASSWYPTLSFTESAEQRGEDGKMFTEKWWEEAKLPGRLRIDVGYPASDTVHPRRIILFANDSTFVAVPGKPVRRANRLNLFLILGFDIYKQPAARTIEQLKGQGFNLSLVHQDTWHGRSVLVVGAAAGDTTSKQFWVDRERDLFVRMLVPAGSADGGTSDAWFAQYRRYGGGWVGTEVGESDKRGMQLHEIYSDIKPNDTLPDAWFDPARLR